MSEANMRVPHLSSRFPRNESIASFLVAVLLLTAVADTDGAERDQLSSKESDKQLLLIRHKGKFGVIDRAGNLIVEPKYDSPWAYDSSRRVYEPDYFDELFREGLRPGKIDSKWGYFDREHREIIAPQFSMAGLFKDGLAQVQVGDDWGIIDRTGNFIAKPQYSFIGPFRDGLARVAKGGYPLEGGLPKGKWGFIDKKGNEIVPAEYAYAHSFLNGRALVNVGGRWRGESGLAFEGGRWGVIDKSGEFIVEPKIEIDERMSLEEKLSEVNDGLIPVKYDEEFGYRDSQWKFVIKPQYEEASPFREHLALVRQTGRFGYIQTSGEWVIEPQFLRASDFSEGLASVVTENGVGYIDHEGKQILAVDCDEARPFEDGLAVVRVDKLWGVIDRSGHFIHKPQFTRIDKSDEFHYIQTANGRGLMDSQGKVIVEPKYDYIGGFQENGFAMIGTESIGLPSEFWVIDRKGNLVPGPMLPFHQNRNVTISYFPKQVNGKWGIVDTNGEFVIAPRFTDVKMLGVGILGVHEKRKWGMANLLRGKMIIEPTYYSIDRFSEGLAETRPNLPRFPAANGDWVGYIDVNGRLVIPNKFARGSQFKNGIANVGILYKGDMDLNYINTKGEFLWKPD